MTEESILKGNDFVPGNPRYLCIVKNFPTFFSFGPQLVTPDEVPDVMKLEIQSCGGVVRDTEYGADILLRAAFPAGGAERFAPRLTEFSAGALEMLPDGEEFLPGPREAL